MNAQVNLDQLKEVMARTRQEVGKVIIGQSQVIDQALIAIFTGQHALIEGVPGLCLVVDQTTGPLLRFSMSRWQVWQGMISRTFKREFLHEARSLWITRVKPEPVRCLCLLLRRPFAQGGGRAGQLIRASDPISQREDACADLLQFKIDGNVAGGHSRCWHAKDLHFLDAPRIFRT